MSTAASRREPAYIGLMSGTSLDGISAAAVRFRARDDGRVDPELLGFVSRPYTADQRRRLADALVGVPPGDYCSLAFDLGAWLADVAIAVQAEAGLPHDEIRAIASHGQTIWHDPARSTWQMGESAVIAERTRIDVISDFRVRDVAAGGQGAPLVPVADALLFASGSAWRALQNIGGIGNVTVVPPGGRVDGVRAFDTGPGVAVIDGVVRALYPGLVYDEDGALARRGTPVESVVTALLGAPYFTAPPPKSTGRELFTPAYIERLIAACRAARRAATSEDIVATAVSLTARSIADAYARFLPEPVDEVLLSGGGARNPVLREMIERLLAPRRVRAFDALYFDGEAKEAVAFALLGWMFVNRRPGNLPGATGARGPRILGKLTPA